MPTMTFADDTGTETQVSPHELRAYALILAKDAGDNAAVARIRELTDADLEELFAEEETEEDSGEIADEEFAAFAEAYFAAPEKGVDGTWTSGNRIYTRAAGKTTWKSANPKQKPEPKGKKGAAKPEDAAVKPPIPTPEFGPGTPPGPVGEPHPLEGKSRDEMIAELGKYGAWKNKDANAHNPWNLNGDKAKPELLNAVQDAVAEAQKGVSGLGRPKITDVYNAVKKANPGLSQRDFQDALVRLQKDKKVNLGAYTLAPATIKPEDLPNVFPLDRELKHYIEPGSPSHYPVDAAKPSAAPPAAPTEPKPSPATPKPAKPAPAPKPAKADPAVVHAEFKTALVDPEKMTAESAAGLVAKAKTLSAPELKKLVDTLGIGKGGSRDTKAQRQAKVEKHLKGKVGGAKPAATQPPAAKPPAPAPVKPTTKAEVPAGHTVEADMGNGVVTAKDPKTGDLTTHFPKGMPEQQADRLAKAIGDSYDELKLFPDYEDGMVPMGMLSAYVKRAVPSTTDADVMAAVSGLSESKAAQSHGLNEVQKLQSDKTMRLGDGKDMASSALWKNGRALAFLTTPRVGMTGKDMVAEYQKNKPKTFAAPGPPPRAGLVWKEETHRWVHPHTGEEVVPESKPSSPVPQATSSPVQELTKSVKTIEREMSVGEGGQLSNSDYGFIARILSGKLSPSEKQDLEGSGAEKLIGSVPDTTPESVKAARPNPAKAISTPQTTEDASLTHPVTFGDNFLHKTEDRAAVIPGPVKKPSEYTPEELSKMPLVYRGEPTGTANAGHIYYTNSVQEAHAFAGGSGKVVAYRVLPGTTVYTDPETEMQMKREVPANEILSLPKGQMIIHNHNTIPVGEEPTQGKFLASKLPQWTPYKDAKATEGGLARGEK